jgi:glycosyltransferase involved in cell wall biosynthesis
VRPLAYKLAGRLVARRLHAAFPISGKAVEQLKAMGTPVNRIFPFGYFVPSISAENPDREAPKSNAFRLVFVGSLIARKGLPTLIEAVKRLRIDGHDVELDVYGPGDASLLESNGVHYRGVIPFGRAQQAIRLYDLLVLPSLHDGWGVVVNEALIQGVPALVSSACGAKTLIEVSGAGSIFEAGSADDLMRALREEFDHNISLQMYVSDECWNKVKRAREETGELYKVAFTRVKADSSAAEFGREILHLEATVGNSAIREALMAVRIEMGKHF